MHRKGCPLDPRASPSAQGLTQLPAYQGKGTRTRPVLGLRHMACGHLVMGFVSCAFFKRAQAAKQRCATAGCARLRVSPQVVNSRTRRAVHRLTLWAGELSIGAWNKHTRAGPSLPPQGVGCSGCACAPSAAV